MFILKFIPKNYLSHFIGWLAGIRAPHFINLLVIKWFAKRYGVKLHEAERDVATYASLRDFFIRNLKVGVRSIGEGVVSPVDGRISEFGEIDGEKILQVKGKYYSVAKLLGDPNDTLQIAKRFCNGVFATIYLAPGDYHHIHSPVDGKIVSSIYIQGNLWPVNNWSVENIEGVFSENERVATLIESEFGLVAVVKVGATNVGSITVPYDESLRTNTELKFWGKRARVSRKDYSPAFDVRRGERIGTFNLGSTVVLLFEKNKIKFGSRCIRDIVQLGETLAQSC